MTLLMCVKEFILGLVDEGAFWKTVSYPDIHAQLSK